MVSKKPGFSETSRPGTVLIFIAHLEGTLMDLYMKLKKIEKKIFFAWERGGVPLRGHPPFPVFLTNGRTKFFEIFRVDSPRWVEQ